MKFQKYPHPKIHLLSLGLSIALVGCANTPADDPWQGWNQNIQSFNDGVDSYVLKPLAKGYHWATPDTVDQGVTNFFSNINDIGVTFNDMLQFKMLQSGMDVGRFVVNTTVGIGGMIDVASEIDLPKHHEDFGQTLGFWGVPSGPYLVLPFFGPSSPRDTLGLVGDAALNPLTYVSIVGGSAVNAATAGAKAVDVVDYRSDNLSTEKVINEAAGEDHYEFIKNSYEQRRKFLINDGNVPEEDDFEDIESEVDQQSTSEPSSTATTQPLKSTEPAPTNSRPLLDLSAPEN